MRLVLPAIVLSAGPVEKVVELLKDLSQQIKLDGKEEEKTYHKFKRFCDEERDTKEEAIAEGENQQTTLEAKIDSQRSRRTDAEGRAKDAQTRIAELHTESEEEHKRREKEEEDYKVAALDLAEAITAVRGAIDSLEASRRPGENAGGGTGNSFVQLSGTDVLTVRKAVLMADALGLTSRKKGTTARILSLLEKHSRNAPANNRQDYEFHSSEILKVIQTLEQDLVDEKQTLDSKELDNKKQFGDFVLSNNESREAQERSLDKEQKLVAQITSDIGETTRLLDDTKVKLHDDRSYLENLIKDCEDKAKTFDQRKNMRDEERAALLEATGIIEKTVAETHKVAVRFVQTEAQPGPEHDTNDQSSTTGNSMLEAVSSFVQIARRTAAKAGAAFLGPQDSRARVASLLRKQSMVFKSAAFARLSAAVASEGNPFEKILGMIQAMIERLQEEAQTDQDKNNYCTKQTKLATQQRDIRAGEVQQLNQSMEEGEARRDQLSEQERILTAEIADLEAAHKQASEEREAEKTEHQRVIDESKNGLGALRQATDVLRRFYEDRGAKAEVTLVHRKPKNAKDYPSAPDAGFKNHAAYKGNQGAAKGILGMIEVIKSDYKRTIAKTEKDEQEAKLAFVKLYEGENQSSQDQKKKLKQIAEDKRSETETKLSDDGEAMTASQNLLDKAIEELNDLHESCVMTEMSYEERVARREDEIQSLKQALCILQEEGPNKEIC